MITISDNTPDGMWSKIGLNIPDAKSRMMRQIFDVMADENFYNMLRERYERGSEEHDHEWLTWHNAHFIDNAVEEILDCILYHAMNIVREDHVKKYGPGLTESDIKSISYSDVSDADIGATIKPWVPRATDDQQNQPTDTGDAA